MVEVALLSRIANSTPRLPTPVIFTVIITKLSRIISKLDRVSHNQSATNATPRNDDITGKRRPDCRIGFGLDGEY